MIMMMLVMITSLPGCVGREGCNNDADIYIYIYITVLVVSDAADDKDTDHAV